MHTCERWDVMASSRVGLVHVVHWLSRAYLAFTVKSRIVGSLGVIMVVIIITNIKLGMKKGGMDQI